MAEQEVEEAAEEEEEEEEEAGGERCDVASNVCQAPPSQYLDGASGKRGGRRAASCRAHSARDDSVTGTFWSSPATAAASVATARVVVLGNGCRCIEDL